jgi:hypothetical protein
MGTTTLPVHAARPMVTDDARIVDAKACQVESWVRRNDSSTEFWALLACDPTGNLEITFGGALTRDGGLTQTTDVVLQGKTIFRPLETNGWGGWTCGRRDPSSRSGFRAATGRMVRVCSADFLVER